MTNYRRSLTYRSDTVNLVTHNEEYFMKLKDKRKDIINDNIILKKHINQFKTIDNKLSFYENILCIVSLDEIDIISKKLSLSSNTATGFIPTNIQICTIDQYLDKPKIPLFPLSPELEGAKEFYNNFPNFTTWLISKIVHAKQVGNIYKLGNDVKKISKYEVIQTMFGFMQGCINNFWHNKDKESLHILILLSISIKNYLLLNDNNNINSNDNSLINNFENALEKRDSNIDMAIKYKELCNNTNVSQIYNIFYQLSTFKTDFVERSVFPSLSEFILGLLTQFKLGESGIKLVGIEEQLLRMIWERSLKNVSQMSELDTCYDIETLTKKIHEKSGNKIENSLRYWTFFTQIIKYILLNNNNTTFITKFNILSDIRDNIKSLNGLNTLSLIISPSIKPYLSDESIADILLIASKSINKRMVLSMLPLVSKVSPTNLINLIKQNLNRVQEMKNNLNNIRQPIIDNVNIYSDFRLKHHNHVYSGTIVNEFYLILISLLQNNDIFNLIHIKNGIINDNTLPVIGVRKFISFIKHFNFYINNIPDIFNKLEIDNINYISYPLNKRVNKILKDLNVNFNDKNNNIKNIENNNIYDPIEYIPLSDAIQKQLTYNEAINKVIMDNCNKIECFICLEEYNNDDMLDLHNNIHNDKICKICKPKLNNCPLCRIRL